MKIKVKTKEGAGSDFILKGSVDEIHLEDEKGITKIEKVWNIALHRSEWTITEKEKITTLKGQTNLSFDDGKIVDCPFIGLWITSKNYFVNVISNGEAYVITETGIKLASCVVDFKGEAELVGKLVQRHIGPEEKTTKGGLLWPILQ